MSRRVFTVGRLPGFAMIAILTLVFLYLPIVTLVGYSFNAAPSMSVWEGFSLRWYQAAAANQAVQEASARSLLIAISSATMSSVLATMAALATTRKRRFRGQMMIYALINQPLMVPEIVTGVALLIFFAMIKIATGYQGLGYLIVAHTAFCIPFAYLPIRARLETMDLALERAAADLYATPFQAFRYVTAPLLTPGILAGLMLSFVTSLDIVVITEFVKSGGQETLPTYMLGQMRRVITPEMNAVSTMFLLLSLACLAVFFMISGKKK